MACGCGAGVCEVLPRRRIYVLHGVHSIMFQAEVFAILACVNDCEYGNYIGEHMYICSDSQATLRALEASRITSRLFC
jgi:hypothetical protein